MRQLLTAIFIFIFSLFINAQQQSLEDIRNVRLFIKEHMGHTVKEGGKSSGIY